MEGFRALQRMYIMNSWWSGSNSVNILITGKTGTGKSSLVNAILGKCVAKVGDNLDPETSEVTSFETDIEGIKVTVWDSPGLQDGLNQEDTYLNNIEACCKDKIDLFIYCVSMENNRFVDGNRDIDSMLKLTEKLGKEIWNNAVFILTCANRFITAKKSTFPETEESDVKIKDIFYKRLEEWKRVVRKCLQDKLHLPTETIEKLPILPAGRKRPPLLLKGEFESAWLSKLWMESLLVTKHDAQPALIKMNLQRLTTASDIHSAKEFSELLKKERIIIEDRAVEFGKEVCAEQAGRQVGRLTGERKCLAQLFTQIFSNLPNITCHGTAVVIDSEFGIVAQGLLCNYFST